MVGQPHVHRVGIGGGVHRHRLDPHFVRRAVDAQRDLAAVGDQDALDAHGARPGDHDQRLVEFDRLRVLDQDRGDRAGRGRGDRVHHLHRLDDQQGVAGLHLSPTDEGPRPARA
jgi:hypothetical protein